MSKKKMAAGSRGIVTACDEGFFGALQYLVLSARGKLPIAVFDLGLAFLQRQWLEDHDVFLTGCELIFPRRENFSARWNKPAYIFNSPYDHTLWVDADARLVGDPSPMWKVDPWVSLCRGDWPQQVNDWRLYRDYPVPYRLPTTSMFNTGVMRWSWKSVQSEVFKKWADCVKLAAENIHVRKLFTWQDEGALQYAIEATSSEVMIVDQPGWNKLTRPPWRFEDTDVIRHYVHGAWKKSPQIPLAPTS